MTQNLKPTLQKHTRILMTEKAQRVHPAIAAKRNPPPGRVSNRPEPDSPLNRSHSWHEMHPMGASAPYVRPARDIADVADRVGAHA